MIEINDLTYAYPNAQAHALRGINLAVPEGQFCAVVGANRAGKSTLCYAIAGFVPHFYGGTYTGSVRVAGRSVAATPLGDLTAEVSLVFANPFNQISGARFTVREEVAFGLENLGVPRAEMEERIAAALETAGIGDLAGRSPYALSGGQQQRVAIASVLVMRPKVLVLDEPTSQLDPMGTRDVFGVLAELARTGGTTVVLAEHKLEWIAVHADRVVLLADGEIVMDGPPQEVLGSDRLDVLGMAPTRYTQAARLAVERGAAPGTGALPVTLAQAESFFGPGHD